jgi:hypothetical protein
MKAELQGAHKAQRLLGQELPQPTFLLMSAEEGGFARRGFWLMRRARDPEWHADSIFAHETGHVLLRRLLSGLPPGYSRVPHSSLAITDYPTAFDAAILAAGPLARE